MTNIAQIANCLHALILTEGSKIALTPTFHVYEMYRAHQGARAIRTDIQHAPLMTLGERSRSSISVSASRSGREVLLTMVNQSPEEALEAAVDFLGGEVERATGKSLSGPSVRAENTVENPKAVVPREAEIRVAGNWLRLELPAGSVQAVTGRLKGG